MRERERERERDKEREREIEYYVAFGRRIVDEEAKIRQKKFTPTIFPFVDSGPISLGFHGNLSQEICGASSLMFIMGEREREKEREMERERGRERDREREREREREKDGESTSQDHIIYNEMRIALHMCLPDNFLVCWPPATALSVFHGNLPQQICRLCL